MLQHLFLSPHFDDAVGSCGGTIARLISLGQHVRILTAFGGDEQEPFSLPARVLHAEWRLDHPVRQRRLEDAAACRVLGCESSFLEFPDAIYRQNAHGSHLYPTFESLRGPISPEDSSLADRLAAAVKSHLGHRDTVVYSPLGIGAHVDHVLTRDCGRLLRTNVAVVDYTDFYYDVRGAGAPACFEDNPLNVKLTAGEIAQKIAAFSEYRSQISDLFGGHDGMTSYFTTSGSTVRESTSITWYSVQSEPPTEMPYAAYLPVLEREKPASREVPSFEKVLGSSSSVGVPSSPCWI